MLGRHQRVLITGGAGFIGSYLVDDLVKKFPKTHFYNLDWLTYAADISRVEHLETYSNYTFIKADIRNEKLIDNLFQTHRFDGVFHLAAESHVDNSIENPKIFLETNVLGTFNLLNAARKLWLKEEKSPHPRVHPSHPPTHSFDHARFLHVSTDEVYGSLDQTGYFTETTPYAPNSPYSASKASSDMTVRSFFHTYKLPVVITNCSNNYGPNQHKEKLIPAVIQNAIAGQPIRIYGTGGNIRDWLYVGDHCSALVCVFQKGTLGESYNIGTNNEKTNLELVYQICDLLEELRPSQDNIWSIHENKTYRDLITFVEDRKGHDFRYAIDATKIAQLGWKPESSFSSQLKFTIQSYLGDEKH